MSPFKLKHPLDSLLFATVRLEVTTPRGTSFGTGFFLQVDVDATTVTVALVTNAHVVRDATRVRFCAHLSDEKGAPSGEIAWCGLHSPDSWIFHPSADLCALPFGQIIRMAEVRGQRFFLTTIKEADAVTAADLAGFSASEQVLMVGYPISLMDETNNLPIMRRGYTATHPKVDFGGDALGLTDMAAFAGSSGSPVFRYSQELIGTGRSMQLGWSLRFLGVHAASYSMTAEGELTQGETPSILTPTVRSMVPAHIGRYVKAREVLALARQCAARVHGERREQERTHAVNASRDLPPEGAGANDPAQPT